MMLGWFKRAGLWIAAIAAIIFAAWMSGKKSQRQTEALKTAKTYAKTRKEIDNVETSISDDPAVLRDWLRDRGKQ
jgi:hypothetical protein